MMIRMVLHIMNEVTDYVKETDSDGLDEVGEVVGGDVKPELLNSTEACFIFLEILRKNCYAKVAMIEQFLLLFHRIFSFTSRV